VWVPQLDGISRYILFPPQPIKIYNSVGWEVTIGSNTKINIDQPTSSSCLLHHRIFPQLIPSPRKTHTGVHQFHLITIFFLLHPYPSLPRPFNPNLSIPNAVRVSEVKSPHTHRKPHHKSQLRSPTKQKRLSDHAYNYPQMKKIFI
jgi:hypothetical protein